VLNGKCNRQATIFLKGGQVDIVWNEKTGEVFLTGKAEWVFNGEYLM
jgi:diaminopimelate epimerase